MLDRKFSVITVCKNEGRTLEQTILSVKNQTYKNIEHIIIDGNSTDETESILKKYKKDLIILSENDNGIYDAMNKGLTLATGDFIIFINANDYFYDEKVVENVNSQIDNNPNAEFIYGQGVFVELNNPAKIVSIISNKYIKNVYDIYDGGMFNHQSVFYKKTLFEKYGNFSTKYKIVSDNVFNLKCVIKHRCKVMLSDLYISKRSTCGISTSDTELLKRERIQLRKIYFPFYRFVSLAIKLLKYFCPKNFVPLNSFVEFLKEFNKINYV